MPFRVAYSFEFLVAYPEVNVRIPFREKLDNRWPDGTDEIQPLDPCDGEQLWERVNTCILKVCELMARENIPVLCLLPERWVDRFPSIAPGAEMVSDKDQPLLIWNRVLLHALPDMDLPKHYWFVGNTLNKHLANRFVHPRFGTPEAHYEWLPIIINTPAVVDKGEDSGRLTPITGILSLLRENMKIWVSSDMSSTVHIFPEIPSDITFCSRLAALALLTEFSVLFAMSHPLRRLRLDCQPNSIAAVSTHESVSTANRDRELVPAAFRGVDNQRILTELELCSGELSRNRTPLVDRAQVIELAVKDLICRPNTVTLRNGLRPST